MLKPFIVPVATWTVLAAAAAAPAEPARTAVNWPQFRGPAASGVADGFPLPAQWDVEKGENIKWKTMVPGLAHSSPIAWGDRIFVTTAVSSDPNPYLRVGLYGESPKHDEKIEHEFRLLCLDKNTGRVLWDRLAARSIPKVSRHIKATHANCTPATDGKYVVAFFGSEGMACYDMEGKPKWMKQFDTLDAGPADATDLQWGFASSPVIYDGKIIVQCDARNQAYVAVYDLETGKGVWKTDRPLYPCWGTPTVYRGPDITQVIVNGYKHIGGYDFATGAELWKMHGGGDVPVPTPVVAEDLIFITNAHGGQAPVYAVKTSARGDITLQSGSADQAGPSTEAPRSNEHIAWSHPKIGNYMQTPLVYNGLLYLCRDNGIMACHEAQTGKNLYKQRLDEGVGFTASPVAGDGKVYFTSEEGDVHVLKAGATFERLGKNKLGEIHMATPAISEGTLFFRTKSHLIAVAELPKAPAAEKPAEGPQTGSQGSGK
jgi:outer membrane protein assembly factor BamB